ncbi:hypothetical protein EBR56_11860, partial [bacterium]|nr:hypothetical protein [bacterium]
AGAVPAPWNVETREERSETMTQFLVRFDRGPSERFAAVNAEAAADYVRELLLDEGAEEGDGGSLYLVDEGGRGEEEHLGEVRLGDDAEPTHDPYCAGWGGAE